MSSTEICEGHSDPKYWSIIINNVFKETTWPFLTILYQAVHPDQNDKELFPQMT